MLGTNAPQHSYPSFFAPQVRWLRSLALVTELSLLPGPRSLAACLQHELFRVTPQVGGSPSAFCAFS
ncbi:hypothetical protein CS537_20255 [Yersinia mollaretii]|nr:hypothetical protein CS537_20255 [Yersinia mollaretii]